MPAPLDAQQLDQRIAVAHRRGDGFALVNLYQQAADLKRAEGDESAFWFLITHAFVFALENGHADAEPLHALLKGAGRES
ncbi:MAG: hypothetical protein OXR62_11235 [Ahrensia sp.]|nr:hypothetical protein [Ahrensia sp.]